MKAILAGIAVNVLVVAAGGGLVIGLILGAGIAYLVWRLDATDRRLKLLERSLMGMPGLPEEAAPRLQPWQPTSPLPPLPPPPPPARKPALAASGGSPSASTPPVPAAGATRVTNVQPTAWWTFGSPDLEQLLAGRVLAVVGGLALIIGGIFFLGLAFSRGWIGPEGRVVLGLAGGAVIYGLGIWFLLRRGNRAGGLGAEGAREVLAHVLIAVGLAVLSLSLFAATRLYEFVPPEVGVAGALLAAATAAVVAVAARSQLVAGFGLVAVLAAPPVMGASATLLTVIFLGAALAGTTVICLYTSWRWLPSIAFVLTAPQVASYVLGDPTLAVALPALAVFWALNALSAAGEELRTPRHRLSATSATLIVASGTFVVWAGFALLHGSLEPWRGLYLLGLGAAHLALGSFFLMRDGEQHPFGMLALGSGIAALTLAVPVQLGAHSVPMAWAAEAVALAWVYAVRRHLYGGGAAVVLGLLAIGHLLVVEYGSLVAPVEGAIPFGNANGAALGFVVLAAAVAVVLLRNRAERIGLAGVMAAVVALVLPQEMRGLPMLAAYAAITTGLLLVERRVLGVPITLGEAPSRSTRTGILAGAERTLYGAAAISGGLGIWFALAVQLPPDRFVEGLKAWAFFAQHPFFDEQTAAAGIIVAAAAVVGGGVPDRTWRWVACLVGAVTIAYLVPFEAGPAWSVVAWLGLGIALHLVATRSVADGRAAVYAFALAAVSETLLVVAAPDRLLVRGVVFPEPPLLNGATLVAAAMAIAFAARALLAPANRDARVAALLSGAWTVYLLSIGTVDVFQAQLGGVTLLEELQKQAQVALSVLWAVLGVMAFVTGLARRLPWARFFGLGLLAVVTAKVFVVDLAALDVAYRVLSFVALGLLLLGAAYLYSRLQPERLPRTDPAPAGTTPGGTTPGGTAGGASDAGFVGP